ncbi:MAG: hypothetical protein FWF36_08785, partial [Propionibacteriaceae bacterium]|nr:hypothetical protein [Propionibacteriaceae bacterium]
FTLPIDRYGMSLRDVQLVDAAHTVLFLRCMNGHDQLDDAEIQNVRQWLAETPITEGWMFGNWDAPFIAKNGGGQTGPRPLPVPLGPDQYDEAQARACVNDNTDVVGMFSIAPAFGRVSPTQDSVSALSQYWGEGVARTEADPLYATLSQQRNQCTQSHGYSIYASEGGSAGNLAYDDNWTSEQRLQAELAEASCSDDMGYTQQVIDMVATYQMVTISEHQAELVAIKQVLDDRVAKATQILTDIGVV